MAGSRNPNSPSDDAKRVRAIVLGNLFRVEQESAEQKRLREEQQLKVKLEQLKRDALSDVSEIDRLLNSIKEMEAQVSGLTDKVTVALLAIQKIDPEAAQKIKEKCERLLFVVPQPEPGSFLPRK